MSVATPRTGSEFSCWLVNACASAGCLPPTGWTEVDQRVDAVFSPTTSDLGSGMC